MFMDNFAYLEGCSVEEHREINLKELFAYILSSREYIERSVPSQSRFSSASPSLTTSDVAAAKSPVDTYITIIEPNSVLEDIVDSASF